MSDSKYTPKLPDSIVVEGKPTTRNALRAAAIPAPAAHTGRISDPAQSHANNPDVIAAAAMLLDWLWSELDGGQEGDHGDVA